MTVSSVWARRRLRPTPFCLPARSVRLFIGRETSLVRRELGHRAGPAWRPAGAAVVTPSATAGVEIALWDIAAREAGLPLHALLGEPVEEGDRVRRVLRAAPRARRVPAEIASYCASMVDVHGSPAFEGKVGVLPPAEELELVRLVREAIGPARMLRLDANMGWSLGTAQAMLARLRGVLRRDNLCSPPRSRYNLAGFHTRLSCAAQGKFRRPRVTESKALPQPGGFLPRYECVSRSGRRSS